MTAETAIARGHETIGAMLDGRQNHHPQHSLGAAAQAAHYAAVCAAETAANPLHVAIDAARGPGERPLGHVLTPDEIAIVVRVAEAFEAAHHATPHEMP